MTTPDDGVLGDMTGEDFADMSDRIRHCYGRYGIDDVADVFDALHSELSAMTARALAAEADVTRQMAIANEAVNALEAMRQEPTAEEITDIANSPDVRQHFCGACKAYKEHHDAAKSVVAAFLAARGK